MPPYSSGRDESSTWRSNSFLAQVAVRELDSVYRSSAAVGGKFGLPGAERVWEKAGSMSGWDRNRFERVLDKTAPALVSPAAVNPIVPAVLAMIKRRLDTGWFTFYCELRVIEALNQHCAPVYYEYLSRTVTLFHQIDKTLRNIFRFAYPSCRYGVPDCLEIVFTVGRFHSGPKI